MNVTEITDIQNLIARTRKKMIDAGQSLGYTAPETVALSQELDDLIIKVMRRNVR